MFLLWNNEGLTVKCHADFGFVRKLADDMAFKSSKLFIISREAKDNIVYIAYFGADNRGLRKTP